MDWYLMVWQKYAQFTGRSRRKEYWMFFLFNMIACAVLYCGRLLVGLPGGPENDRHLSRLLCVPVCPGGAGPRPRGQRAAAPRHQQERLVDPDLPGSLCGGLILLVLDCIEGDPGDNHTALTRSFSRKPAIG